MFKDRVHGMFAGVAIGDALGMPVETMDRKDIRALNNGKGVIGYMEQVSVRPGEEKRPLGTTTDDWQLTRAVIRGIINAKGFDLGAIAKEHVREMELTTFGWGKGTIRSLEEIRDGKRTPGEPPLWHEEGKGCGNGVVMKISPIAAFGVIHVEQSSKNKEPMTMLVDDYVNALSSLTHPDPRASFAAMWINALLLDFLLSPRGDMLIHPRAILTMDPLPEWDFGSPLCI
jgi:ADP-ribosylglycohydrolase